MFLPSPIIIIDGGGGAGSVGAGSVGAGASFDGGGGRDNVASSENMIQSSGDSTNDVCACQGSMGAGSVGAGSAGRERGRGERGGEEHGDRADAAAAWRRASPEKIM